MGEFEEYFGEVEPEVEVAEDASLNSGFGVGDNTELNTTLDTDDSFAGFMGDNVPTIEANENDNFDLDSMLDSTEALPVGEPELPEPEVAREVFASDEAEVVSDVIPEIGDEAETEADVLIEGSAEAENIVEAEAVNEAEAMSEAENVAEISDEPSVNDEEVEIVLEPLVTSEEVAQEREYPAEPELPQSTSVTEEPYQPEPNFVQWYSGSVHDQMFEVAKNNIPAEIVGDENNRIIHINIGNDSYGWLVEFDSGQMMSLEDVRKYQIRNGALPSKNGILRYGANTCAFSNIERILIYKSVRYFSYG